MLKLYGGARSRASIVQWYLEELNLPYEYVLLDLPAGEHRQAPFLSINPVGKVPAIVDGDLKLWESGAILLYLSDQYGAANSTPQERGLLAQWVLYANATLGPGLFLSANRDQEAPRLLSPLNDLLQQQPYLRGEHFSVADVAIGSILIYAGLMIQFSFTDYPAIASYIKRLGERTSFQQSIGKRSA